MTKEQMLEDLIKSRYGNLKKFSDETGIPYMTIRNIIQRGIDRASVVTMIKITRTLSIDLDALVEGRLELRPNEQKETVLNMYRRHPIDLDKVTEEDLALLEAIQRLPEEQKPLLLSLLRGNGEPPR